MNKLRELELETIEEEKDESFKVEDLNQANWCFRKLKAIEEKKQEINDLAEQEIERIKAWQSKELESYESSEDYFHFLLEDYYKREKAKDNKFKLSTPYGKVSSRKQQPKFNRDNEKLVEWLKENSLEDYIQVEEKAQWGELKKNIQVKDGLVLTEDGLIVEGIEAEERPAKITIKVE